MELIGKQIAIETILGQPPELHYPSWYAAQIEKLPPAPPEYLAEQAGILVTDSDTISRQAAINALERTKRIASHELHGGEVLRTFNVVLNSLINIMSLLPPANNSEKPNSSDTISRQMAIEALKNDMASLDHIIKGMSANDVRLDAYVSQRNQVNYDIYTINNLPPAQPEQLGTDCISRQAAIKKILGQPPEPHYPSWYAEQIKELPTAEPKRGKWIHHPEIGWGETWLCDQCGEKTTSTVMGKPRANFCPNCGADMREVTT